MMQSAVARSTFLSSACMGNQQRRSAASGCRARLRRIASSQGCTGARGRRFYKHSLAPALGEPPALRLAMLVPLLPPPPSCDAAARRLSSSLLLVCVKCKGGEGIFQLQGARACSTSQRLSQGANTTVHQR